MLLNCLEPKIVRNKLTGEDILVPCGKCHICNYKRSMRYVPRLEDERFAHKFSYFVTLDYAPEFVPKMIYENGYVRYSDDFRCADDFPIDEVFSVAGNAEYNEREISWLQRCQKFQGAIYVLNFHDIQAFMKRVRRRIQYLTSKYSIHEKVNIRYFAAGEYGPRTYRPHYHLLLFFDSEYVNAHIEQILREKWTYGTVITEFAGGSVSSYVSAYVNSAARCPLFLRKSYHRPHFQFSKNPFLGASGFTETECRNVVCNRIFTVQRYIAKSNSYAEIPIPFALMHELLPQYPRFIQYDKSFTCALLRNFDQARQCGFASTSRKYAEWCRSYITYHAAINSSVSTKMLVQYFTDIDIHYNDAYQNIRSINCYCRLFTFLRKAERNCLTFGISIQEYADLLEYFYKFYYHQQKLHNFYSEWEMNNPTYAMLTYINDFSLENLQNDSDYQQLYLEYSTKYAMKVKTKDEKDTLAYLRSKHMEYVQY